MLLDNIKIIECNPKQTKCLIAFSSNNARQGKFEFENICKSKTIRKGFHKILFVRDPICRFFVNGINKDVDSIEKMLVLIKELTREKKIFCVGNSAGGYMSLLCGGYLDNVERILNFGGIINVLDWHGSHSDYNFSDSRHVKSATEEKRKYFDISKALCNINCSVYSFYSAHSEADIQIVNQLNRTNFPCNHSVLLNTNVHGDYCLPFDYKILFVSNDKYLIKLFNRFDGKIVSRNTFSFCLHGPFMFVLNWFVHKTKRFLKQFKKAI